MRTVRIVLAAILTLSLGTGCLKKFMEASKASRGPSNGELTKSPTKKTGDAFASTGGVNSNITDPLPAPKPLLESPQIAKDLPYQDPKTLVATASEDIPPFLEKRIEKREERKEKRNPTPATPDKPGLPSPFEKDTKPAPAPTPPATTVPPAAIATPAPSTKPSTDLDEIKKYYTITSEQWNKVKDFEARLVKREVVGNKEMPTEELLYRFRKEPMSVYMKNIGDVGKGREVLYVAGKGAKMHIITGSGDNVLLKPGMALSLDPESSMVTSKSRQKITEAGFGKGIHEVGKWIAKAEKGEMTGLKFGGMVTRKEYPYPLICLEVTLKPGEDPLLSKGGKREIYIDPKTDSPSYGLPVVVRALDANSKEVEYYAFDQFKLPANFSDAEFSVERMQKRK